MANLKNATGQRKGLLLLCLLLVLVTVSLGVNLRQTWAKGGDWKNLTLVYSTDVKGKIEPCG